MKSSAGLLSVMLGLVLVLAAVPERDARAEVELGILKCKSVPGTRINLVIRSTVDVTCTFDYAGGQERYVGETGIQLGLDLSFKKNEQFAFTVISANDVPAGNHALAGKYVGGKASASVIVGLGAAALIGGSDDNFGLNPIALEANEGLGASAGLGFLYIEADRRD